MLALLMLGAGAYADDYASLITGVQRTSNNCTAFRVSVDKWLTAGHCAAPVLTIMGEAAILMKADKEEDIAEFKMVPDDGEDFPITYIFRLANKGPEIGDDVVTIGYFAQPRKPLTFFGRTMGGQWDSLKGQYFQLMGAPGGSGAPILKDGKVVSMVTDGVNLSGGTIPIGAVFIRGPEFKALKKFVTGK